MVYISGPDADARGQFTDAGFVVLKGSKSRNKFSKAAADTGFAQTRDRFVTEGLLKPQGASLVFQEDIAFRSPSGAAAIVLARHANGWLSWRNAKGETLDSIKRKKMD